MAYIGKTPASAALTSSDISDGIITTTKIADANVTNPKLTSGSQQNFRNIIINGDMSLAQRGTSATGKTSSGYYSVDRMTSGISSAGTWTQSQSTTVPSGQGFATSLKMDCTTAQGSLGSSDRLQISQKFEGQNLQYLKKGTSSAESTTLSFWVRSNKTGTYIAELYDTDNTRHIAKSYTISSANTWEKKTITYAGDTSGAFGNDNAESLSVFFWLVAGSNFTSGTLATSWSSITNANRAAGQTVNLSDSTSNEWYMTGLQLEAGTSASDFEFLPVDVNLQRCQRYFEKVDTYAGIVMNCYNTSDAYGNFQYMVEKRATPTIAFSGTNTLYTNSAAKSGTLSAQDIKIESFNGKFASSGLGAGNASHLNNTSGTNNITISSEL